MRRAWWLGLVLAAVGCKAETGAAARAGSGGEDAAGGGGESSQVSASGTGGEPSGAGQGGEPSESTAGRGGQSGASSPATAKPTLADAVRDYKAWTKRQSEPQPISTQIFALCRAPSPAETKFTESVHGDNLALLDWVNGTAKQGLDAGGKPSFPVGAAIVKEKLRNGQVAALGIMVKRAAGFDAAHGDWEFGYWEKEPGLSAGSELASACGGCHAGAQTDFVFMDASWRLPH
ncbi:MAG TPA: cytochrome P460 family protein [Polyangiales bacterium]|nr:cytochrome P460 family protein [Polyangiales bacterium]